MKFLLKFKKKNKTLFYIFYNFFSIFNLFLFLIQHGVCFIVYLKTKINSNANAVTFLHHLKPFFSSFYKKKIQKKIVFY